jgi:nucleotide-binding universal stress UspA family protein
MNDTSIVVVPWDFSEYSIAALKFAREKFPNADMRILCVLEKPNPYAPEMSWGGDAEAQAIEKSVAAFRDSARTQDFEDSQFTSLFGEPAVEIVKYANHEKADCIVMSTHGRTGLKKWMLGSVAQRVAERASCPVLLLPRAWVEAHLPTAAVRHRAD